MSETQGKEYYERLKSEAKEFIDGIGTESEFDQRTIKLIYGFVRAGFRESGAGKRNGAKGNTLKTYKSHYYKHISPRMVAGKCSRSNAGRF